MSEPWKPAPEEPRWKPAPEGARCNHRSRELLTCGAPAAWVRDESCGCGAVHSQSRRCHDHRIADLEADLERREKVIAGLIRFARRKDPDIRTDEECLLRAAGYERHPRDEGDELWRELNRRSEGIH